MKKIIIGTLVLTTLLVGCGEGSKEEKLEVERSLDSISSVSLTNFYEESSYSKEEILEALNERKAAVSVATVNEDGTPNASIVIPGAYDDNTLVFGLAENQTGINFKEREFAVVTAYIYDGEAEDRLERNQGARIIIRYNEELNDRLIEENQPREGTIYMEIVDVLPLG